MVMGFGVVNADLQKVVMRSVERPFFKKCSAQNQTRFMPHTVYLLHLDVNAPQKEQNKHNFMGDLASVLQK